MRSIQKQGVTGSLKSRCGVLVRQAVESGEYASSSEVIQEALREWKLRRRLLQQEREALQPIWAEGLASGPARLGTTDEIKQEARRRLSVQATRKDP